MNEYCHERSNSATWLAYRYLPPRNIRGSWRHLFIFVTQEIIWSYVVLLFHCLENRWGVPTYEKPQTPLSRTLSYLTQHILQHTLQHAQLPRGFAASDNMWETTNSFVTNSTVHHATHTATHTATYATASRIGGEWRHMRNHKIYRHELYRTSRNTHCNTHCNIHCRIRHCLEDRRRVATYENPQTLSSRTLPYITQHMLQHTLQHTQLPNTLHCSTHSIVHF